MAVTIQYKYDSLTHSGQLNLKNEINNRIHLIKK